MQSTFLLMVAACTLGSGLAIAQSALERAPDNRSKAPRHAVKLVDQFKSADKDNDGALTRAEAEGAGLHRIVDHFDRLDANKDGKVTIDEIRLLIRSRISS
jgi:Ca2+-binding EF-hand superfamily protein